MTFKIELGKPKADGSCRVYVKVFSSGTIKRVSTNIFVAKNEYVKNSKGLRIKSLEKKTQIDEVLHECESKYTQSLINTGEKISAADVVSTIIKKKNSHDFFKFADHWIEESSLKGKKNYKTAVNQLRQCHGSDTLSFDDLDVVLLKRFENFLKDRPRAQSEYLTAIKHLWEEADIIYDDDMPRSPFRKFKPKRQRPVGQRATTIDIIRKIYEYNGTDRLACQARDYCILSFCLMGMNCVDFLHCQYLKGNVLMYDRAKVMNRRADRGHIEIKVHKFIKDIIARHRNTSKDFVFDVHSLYSGHMTFDRALNKGIRKILGNKCGVTFYAIRHSWATVARNDLKIDKHTVNDALNHVDKEMAVTDLYIKKDFTIINDANEKVIEYVFAPYIK